MFSLLSEFVFPEDSKTNYFQLLSKLFLNLCILEYLSDTLMAFCYFWL